jgi:hypothetical protein
VRNPRILTVDFGSSYTKVAVRTSPNSRALLAKGIALASADLSYCIPTTVARIERGGQTHWLVGQAAAETVPGAGTTIYQNWKADVFAELEDGASGAKRRSDELREVALRFFAELLHQLRRLPSFRDFGDLPVRLCVPGQRDDHGACEWLRRVLKDVGWTLAAGRNILFEPESNALGVLSRGYNRIWTPPMASGLPHYGDVPQLSQMLDPWFLTVARAGLEGDGTGRGSRFRFLAIDVGAFTTDFGLVTFDTSFTTDTPNKPDIIQRSAPLGVKALDEAVRRALPADSQAALQKRSTSDWEAYKHDLYAGKPAEFISEGRRVRIGAGREADAIKVQIELFADRVWQRFEEFVRTECIGALEAVALTGGGMMIPALRSELTAKLRTRSIGRVFELLNDAQAEKQLDERGRSPTPKEKESWLAEGRELLRGGSAIGGCSVFFEWPG